MNEMYLIQLNRVRTKEKHTLTVALVSDRVDRYNTILEPDGCETDFRNVIVDYNHNGKSTGARLKNRRIENITLDNDITVTALVGDIEVYKDSELRNKAGESVENAYNAIENGRITSVSVEFEHIPTETYANSDTGVIRFRKWRLIRLSLLDVAPGQEDSIILNVRSRTNLLNTKKMKKRSYVGAALKDKTGNLYAVTEVREDTESKTLTLTNKEGLSKTINADEVGYMGDESEKAYYHAGMADLLMAMFNVSTASDVEESNRSQEDKEPTEEPPLQTEEPQSEEVEESEDTKRLKELEVENARLMKEVKDKEEEIENTRKLINSPIENRSEPNSNATSVGDMPQGGEGVEGEYTDDSSAISASKNRWM